MRSRNELANWFRMARETGRMHVGAEKRETCSLCCSPLAADDETDHDERGLHHRNLYLCIEALQGQQRMLEESFDDARRMVILLQHDRQLRPPQKNQPGEEKATMRALSQRQAARCETAKNKTCRCRCGGALHGAARMNPEKAGREREFFEALPEDDPHHVPGEEEKKQRRRMRRRQAQAPLQTTLWEELV